MAKNYTQLKQKESASSTGLFKESKPYSLVLYCINNIQAPVVQTLDSAIHRINHYPAVKYYGNQLRYPLDSDLSSG